MLFGVTSKETIMDKAHNLENVRNTSELNAIYKGLLSGSTAISIVLSIIIVVLLIITGVVMFTEYSVTGELSGRNLLSLIGPGIMLTIVGTILFFQRKFVKRIKSEFFNYTVYRVSVNLENKKVHSDDDGTSYSCDLVGKDEEFRISYARIDHTTYKDYNEGYLYIILENEKEALYFSNKILYTDEIINY